MKNYFKSQIYKILRRGKNSRLCVSDKIKKINSYIAKLHWWRVINSVMMGRKITIRLLISKQNPNKRFPVVSRRRLD
jgi:hypothetical protein